MVFSDSVLDELLAEMSAVIVRKDMLCFDLDEVELQGQLAALSCNEGDVDDKKILSDSQCLRSVAASCGMIDSDDEQ